jgi:hypothetical protein
MTPPTPLTSKWIQLYLWLLEGLQIYVLAPAMCQLRQSGQCLPSAKISGNRSIHIVYWVPDHLILRMLFPLPSDITTIIPNNKTCRKNLMNLHCNNSLWSLHQTYLLVQSVHLVLKSHLLHWCKCIKNIINICYYYATCWKVTGLIPNEVTGFLTWPNSSSHTMALGST